MGFNGVDDDDPDLIAEFLVQRFGGSHPLPEGWSGERTKDQDHWLLSQEPRKRDWRTLDVFECEINGQVTDGETGTVEIGANG